MCLHCCFGPLNLQWFITSTEYTTLVVLLTTSLLQLEKEALNKGVPVGKALDIDIPPPRPKRKPTNPYPRKKSIIVPASQVGEKDGKLLTSVSSLHFKQALDLKKEPLPEVDIITFCSIKFI